ncbi:MAG: ABC transporter ATP-binding protein [Candidatus Bipolaricaulota bacterium]|nr:ABC transporter ATP-binding protein [Candidatus Bipolaricaulota bacterium]
MINQSIIILQGIGFHYPKSNHFSLQSLTMTIPKSRITALLGPNGSGKTTLLLLLLGWLKPQQGSIQIDGCDPAVTPRCKMSRVIGLVPQNETYPLGLTVLQYLLLGRAPYLGLLGSPGGGDRRIAQAAIAAVGLEGFKNRPITSLSGGERQLATIARAIVQEPRILLMDEPTAHLDLANKHRVMETINRLVEQEVTVMLTTHDPNVAAEVADEAVLLRGGRLVAFGPTPQVLTEENLSLTYNLPVLVTEVWGRPVVLLHSEMSACREVVQAGRAEDGN